MTTRTQGVNSDPGPLNKERLNLSSLFCVESREAWEWLASMPIERRRYAPDAAVAVGPLLYLVKVVFFQAVRRVSDNRVQTIFRNPP